MGQNNSVGLIRDTVDCDRFLSSQLSLQHMTHLAFQKCLVSRDAESRQLTPEEKTCVMEYTSLYATEVQKGFLQLRALFDQEQKRLGGKDR